MSDIVPSFGKDLADMDFQEMLDAGVIEISEIDDVVVCKQAELVGVPFILFDFEMKSGDMGEYALCRVKVNGGTRVFADGGVGISEQLERYRQRMMDKGVKNAPLYFPNGLRSSSYDKDLPDGSRVHATTYYFDNRSND